MKLSNNTILVFTIIMIVYSISFNMYMVYKIDSSAITGDHSGAVKLCINKAPVFTYENCSKTRFYVLPNYIIFQPVTCDFDAMDPQGQPFHFFTDTHWATIDPITGLVTIQGNISSESDMRPEVIYLQIGVMDEIDTCWMVNTTTIAYYLTGGSRGNFTGGILFTQNYPEATNDTLLLLEGFTTYHHSLYEHFYNTLTDITGVFHPISFRIEYLDWWCYNIETTIDQNTGLVQYYVERGFDTSETGPCRAIWHARDPVYAELKNNSNVFYIEVQKTPLEYLDPKEIDDDAGNDGGGASSNSGAINKANLGNQPQDCFMRNVLCTNWTECIWQPPNTTEIFNYNLYNDGIMTRKCTWMTNCPGELAPPRKKLCDYKPSCNDTLLNCHELPDGRNWCEEKVDCGGPCPACPTCEDWILNQDEKGIDCGGSCEICSKCNDNMKNCIKIPGGELLCEEQIDCGGYCQPCANCSDGIRNCHRLDDGSISCEEGIDCGGPCENTCSEVEQALSTGQIRLLNWLLIFLILIAAILILKKLYPKIYAYYERKYMEYIKRMMQLAQEAFKQNYVRNFEDQLKYLQADFDKVTAEKVKEEGDKILVEGQTTGYNIDRYSVSFDNDYADVLTDNSIMTINYAMYLNNVSHGKRILREVMKLGIKPLYKICKRSSATLWDERWDREPNAKYETINGRLIARTVEYIISFRPKDMDEAKKIIGVLEFYGKGSDKKIADAWDVPDIRVTGKDEFLDFEKHVLNMKDISGQKLLILTKDKVLQDFQDSEIWLNPGLAKFIK